MPIPIDRVFLPPPFPDCILCGQRGVRYETRVPLRDPQPCCRTCAEQCDPGDLPKETR